MAQATKVFHLLETTIADIHQAYAAGELTSRELVQLYLDRIEAYDRGGPMINSVINLNDGALAEADRLDATFLDSGPVGPLHGIPVILKDQMDAAGLPTTLGSVLFKDYLPDGDCTVTAKLKEAGAIVLAKVTLGELGAGDTHGTLFGSTRNPYDLERTVGGSSGGSAAGVSANLAAIAIGQEGFASIRRPSAWTSVVGMRPTAGLVSRAGVYAGWPSRIGSLGPICRTVADVAAVLDVMVGYDSEDPITAHGYGRAPQSFLPYLDTSGLEGARIGILRTSMGQGSEPDSEDFAKVTAVFDKAVKELAAAGAVLVDPIEIPDLKALIARRARDGDASDKAFKRWMDRSKNHPYDTPADMMARPEYDERVRARRANAAGPGAMAGTFPDYLQAREELMTNLLKVMADNKLDAIVHKTVEHTPTLIRDGINPPYTSSKGAPHINTFLIYVPSVTVPAGFTEAEGAPVGITFLGRPYSDPIMLKYAYAYEQSTMHRVPPSTTPPLPGEP